MTQEIKMDSVSVSEDKNSGMTDLQIYGINATVVRLLSKVRKYTISNIATKSIFDEHFRIG